MDKNSNNTSSSSSSSSSSTSSSSSSSSSTGTNSSHAVNAVDKYRLAFPDCARLSVEFDTAVVYHYLDNDRTLHMEGEGEFCGDNNDDDAADEPEEEEEETVVTVPGLDAPVVISKGKVVFPLSVAPAIEVTTPKKHS